MTPLTKKFSRLFLVGGYLSVDIVIQNWVGPQVGVCSSVVQGCTSSMSFVKVLLYLALNQWHLAYLPESISMTQYVDDYSIRAVF